MEAENIVDLEYGEFDLSDPDIFTRAIAELIADLKSKIDICLPADMFDVLTKASKFHGSELGNLLSTACGQPVYMDDDTQIIRLLTKDELRLIMGDISVV